MTSIIEKALQVMEAQLKRTPGETLKQSERVKDFCRLQLAGELDEVFSVLFLDTQLRLLSFEKMFRGTVNQAQAFARPILRRAFELNAARMILAHNHPSGRLTPSDADIEITQQFNRLFKALDCPIVDHIIVTAESALSFVERGITI